MNTSRPFCLYVLFSQLTIFMMMTLLTTTTKLQNDVEFYFNRFVLNDITKTKNNNAPKL